MTVYVVSTNGTLLAAYIHRHHAETHALTITGAIVRELVVFEQLATSAHDDISTDDDWPDDNTPVEVSSGDTVTKPATPRAKRRR